jgi:hypothetical protein
MNHEFDKKQVTAAGAVSIQLSVLVDGLLVGGITYALDPHLKHAAREEHEEPAGSEHRGERRDGGEQGEQRRDDHDRKKTPKAIKIELDLE